MQPLNFIHDLLTEARRHDVVLWADGDTVYADAQRGMPLELHRRLRSAHVRQHLAETLNTSTEAPIASLWGMLATAGPCTPDELAPALRWHVVSVRRVLEHLGERGAVEARGGHWHLVEMAPGSSAAPCRAGHSSRPIAPVQAGPEKCA